MPTITESARIGDLLKREFDKLHNRETITVVTGQNLAFAAVVGKVTASGKYAAYDNGAATGVEIAAGILLEAVDATAADAKGVIIARGPAVVAKSALVFDAGQNAAAQAAAIADLAAIGIIVRTDLGGDPVAIA